LYKDQKAEARAPTFPTKPWTPIPHLTLIPWVQGLKILKWLFLEKVK
jgi:hypothetical protein